MITAAGIEDQELPIAAKWTGVNNPTIAWRRDLCARMRGDGETLLGSTDPIGSAECANRYAVDRKLEMAASVRKGDRRSETPWIAKRRKLGPGRIGFDAARRIAGRAGRRIEAGLELGDEILEVADLLRQVHGTLLLGGKSLLGAGLFFLPRVDQHVQAKLLIREPVEILRQRRAFADNVLADAG